MRLRILVASLLAFTLTACTKLPPPDQHGVTEIKLKNGVTLLIKEDHRQPMVAISTLIKTRETTMDEFISGVRLLSERLFLRASKKYPHTGGLDRALAEFGGTLEATTTIDYAAYGTIIPVKSFSPVIKLFAEGYKEPKLDPSVMEQEIDLITQQQSLPVRVEGFPEELSPDPNALKNLMRDQILTYWKERFHPGLMLVTIVGDISTREALHQAGKTFGKLKKHGDTPQVAHRQPAQDEFQFQQQQDSRSWATVSFITEGLSNSDRYPLYLLSLWLKSRIPTKARIARDYGVIEFTITPKDDDIVAAEKTLLSELEKVKKDPIPEDQLEVFRAQTIFEGLRTQERIDLIARDLAVEAQYGDHNAAFLQGYRLAAVTAEDVQNLAKRYFVSDNVTIREFSNRIPAIVVESDLRKQELFPESEKSTATEQAAKNQPVKMVAPLQTVAKPESKDLQPKTYRLSNDIPVLIRERHDLPLASVIIQNMGGRATETVETAGITNLALRTSLNSPHEDSLTTAMLISGLGGKINVIQNADSSGYALEILSPHLKDGLNLLTKLIASPQISEDAMNKSKQQLTQEIREHLYSPYSISLNLALEAAFGQHPYIFHSAGRLEALSSITMNDLKQRLDKSFAPKDMRIVIVGDVDSTEVRAWLEEGFRDLKSIKTDMAAQPIGKLPAVVKQNSVNMQLPYSALTMLFSGPIAFDTDFAALNILSAITGGPGGRFIASTQDERKLTLQLSTSTLWTKQNGAFAISMQTYPGNEQEALNSVMAQINKIRSDGVSDEEFERGTQYMLSQEQLGNLRNMDLAGKYATGITINAQKDWATEFQNRLKRVTKANIKAVANKYLTPSQYVIGEVKGKTEPQL